MVLLHHAVIPYTYFGHTDPKSWIGFDAVVLATDSFFMAMFFFLSGPVRLARPRHKAPAVFLRDRLLRLGLPFAIAAFTVIPLAYYAISLRQHPEIGFSEFWWKTVTVGPWPSGPIWFVWVLLAFDLTASLLYRVSPHLVDPINRLSLRGFDRPAVSSCFCCRHRARLYSRAALFRSQAMVRIRPVLGAGQPRPALCRLFLHRRRRSVPRISIAACSAPMGSWRKALGLGDRDPRSVLPDVGA